MFSDCRQMCSKCKHADHIVHTDDSGWITYSDDCWCDMKYEVVSETDYCDNFEGRENH